MRSVFAFLPRGSRALRLLRGPSRGPARLDRASTVRSVGPKFLLLVVLGAAIGLRTGTDAWADSIEPTPNAASVIHYPTALEQWNTHQLQGALSLHDVVVPEASISNLGYGYQLASIQLSFDAYSRQLEGRSVFTHAEGRVKLRLFTSESPLYAIALGFLGRGTDDAAKRAYFDDRDASLFLAWSAEISRARRAPGSLINAYLDNRVFALGGKLQLQKHLQLVAEAGYQHYKSLPTKETSEEAPDEQDEDPKTLAELAAQDSRLKLGLGIEFFSGEASFTQLIYDSEADAVQIRLGYSY